MVALFSLEEAQQMQTRNRLLIAAAITIAMMNIATAQAVRVRVQGVCGSGSVCGFAADGTGAYVLTNAHVAGTQIGRTVSIDYAETTGMKTVPATIIAAAYSSTRLTDWALLKCQAIKGGASWRLSTTDPSAQIHATCGSPRCVWPQVCQQVRTRSATKDSTLWRWQPNSIGGQSGSSVRTLDAPNVTKGLLTWSWGGDGAGQTTRSIYRQFVNRTTDAPLRPEGLTETAEQRSYTEEGFFSEAIDDLPIWDTEPVKPPTDPCDPAEPKTKAELEAAIAGHGFDVTKLLELVVRILDFFDNSRR